MNRIILFAVSALAVAGCAKEAEQNTENGGPRKMSFTGRVENNAGTKTSLTDEYDVVWTAGDHISVFAGTDPTNRDFGSSSIRPDESGLENGLATFEGMVQEADIYYAVYPYNSSASISGTTVTTVLPVDQTASAGTFATGANISAAKTSDGNNALQFLNAGAIMGVTVASEGVTGIRLMSGDGARPMAGTVTVDMSGDVPVMSVAEGGSAYVRLLPASAGEGNPAVFTAGATYYFVVAPGEYNGLMLVFENSALDATCTKTHTGTVTVERNGNFNLGSFTIEEGDWEEDVPQSYTVTDNEQLAAYIDGAAGVREVVTDLTISAADITLDNLNRLDDWISTVEGTLTIENIVAASGQDAVNTAEFLGAMAPDGVFPGSIVFRNVTGNITSSGFNSLVEIGGSLIIDNCHDFMTWDGWDSQLQSIRRIGGDVQYLNQQRGIEGLMFAGLEYVGGDFIFENDGFFYLPEMGSLTHIGGDLVLRDNPNLWGLNGFENLETLGGNVVVENYGRLPLENSEIDGRYCIGLCLLRDLVEEGTITGTVTVSDDEQAVDFDTIQSCADYSANDGQATGEAFGEPETVEGWN